MDLVKDHNFVVGQQFSDVRVFRNAIKEAAISQHFELRIVKSDLIRYVAKCAADDCPWRIRAVKLRDAPTFTIKSLEPTHTCGQNVQNSHHQASVDWIVSFIEERLRDDINYKPKDILNDVQKHYGITIPYKQAWRAKERGLAAIYGSSEEGCCVLPAYCNQIRRTNPGSVAEVFTTGADNRFQSLFVSFYASIYGFLNGCLPVVGLSGLQLKNKYFGTLLSATSFDAEGGLFPLAFGVVEEENDESWAWFLSQLYGALEMNTTNVPNLIFLSNGNVKGVEHAVQSKFPESIHAICIHHLSESLGREFKNPRLAHLLLQTALATTMTAFKERMAQIEEITSEAANWISKFPLPSWALVYSNATRYGLFTSNSDEFKRLIVEARELPIIQVLERIQSIVIEFFKERRSRSQSWSSTLVPSAEKRLEEAMNVVSSSSYQVFRSDEFEFEVISPERSHIVNIGACYCSCRGWQLYGIPCSHGVAALLSSKKDVYAFIEQRFTVFSYRETYSKVICPVPEQIDWKKPIEAFVAAGGSRVVRPPNFRRLPGRPEKRICIEEVNREKHTVHCSRCNQTGHYKTTCKTEIL